MLIASVPVLLRLLSLLLFFNVNASVGALSLARSHLSNRGISIHRNRAYRGTSSLLEDTFVFVQSARPSHVPHESTPHNAKAKDLDPLEILTDGNTIGPDASETKKTKSISDSLSTDDDSKHTATSVTSASTASMELSSNVPATLLPAPSMTSSMSDSFTFTGTMPGPIATALPSGSLGSDTGSKAGGISSNNWKVVGIGVLVVGGIVIIVVGFTFFDCWWAFVSHPCGKRKGRKFDHLGDGELIPDWHRGSWRVGLEEQNGDWFSKASLSPDATTMGGQDALGSNEKATFGSLHPPRPPFALRRTPDTCMTLVNSPSKINTMSLPDKTAIVSISKPSIPPPARVSRKAPGSIFETGASGSMLNDKGEAKAAQTEKQKCKKKMRKSTSAPNMARQSRLFLINPDEAEAYGGLSDLSPMTDKHNNT